MSDTSDKVKDRLSVAFDKTFEVVDNAASNEELFEAVDKLIDLSSVLLGIEDRDEAKARRAQREAEMSTAMKASGGAVPFGGGGSGPTEVEA